MNTPGLSLREGGAVLKQYWFAPLISPDYSADVTRVSFLDGETKMFYDQDQIPGISH